MKLTKENLEKEYADKTQSVSKISEKFRISQRLLYKSIKKWGIPLRGGRGVKCGRGRQQQYFANETAFSKWSCQMAYCLGFIAADGHVWKDRPYITISVHKQDSNVLEYIRNYVSPDTKIRPNKNQVQICVKSEGIWKDLNNFGIDNNKTFNLKINFNIPKEYLGDFVRGYFDGDGSIWVAKKNPVSYAGSIVSASRQVLVDIQELMRFGRVRETHQGKYFSLDFSQANLLKLAELIYSNPDNVIMYRKYDKFKKIEQRWIPWTEEEDGLLLENIDVVIRRITHLFPNRSDKTIQARKSLLRKKYGKDKTHYSSWQDACDGHRD